MGCVYEIFNIYQHLDFPQKEYIGVFENFALAENGIKLVKGNQKDLLVFYILIKNELNSPAGVLQEAFKMYDGRDRLFTTVTSTKLVFPQSVEVENTAFDWRETCPPFFFNEIQPGIEAKMKLCFEVPKDSDHFKMIYKKSISTSYEIDSNLILIIDRAFINRIGEKYEIGPITTTGTTTSTMQTADEVDTAVPSQTQTSGGCGPGTVLVNGVCQLAPTQSKSSFMSIEPIYLIIGAVAIGGAIAGIIAVAKRGSKTPKPARQELDEYEEQYLEKEKPARQIETSAFCDNCGKKLKPTAKFCGGCGNQV